MRRSQPYEWHSRIKEQPVGRSCMVEKCGMFKRLKLGKLFLECSKTKWIMLQDESGRRTQGRTKAQVLSECKGRPEGL